MVRVVTTEGWVAYALEGAEAWSAEALSEPGQVLIPVTTYLSAHRMLSDERDQTVFLSLVGQARMIPLDAPMARLAAVIEAETTADRYQAVELVVAMRCQAGLVTDNEDLVELLQELRERAGVLHACDDDDPFCDWDGWLTPSEFARFSGIDPRGAISVLRRAFNWGHRWRGADLLVAESVDRTLGRRQVLPQGQFRVHASSLPPEARQKVQAARGGWAPPGEGPVGMAGVMRQGGRDL